jgi:hypothetical protein
VFAAIRRKRKKTSCSRCTANINTDSKLSLDGRIFPSRLITRSSNCRPIELVEHNVAAAAAASGESMFGDCDAVSDHTASAQLVCVHSAYAH